MFRYYFYALFVLCVITFCSLLYLAKYFKHMYTYKYLLKFIKNMFIFYVSKVQTTLMKNDYTYFYRFNNCYQKYIHILCL